MLSAVNLQESFGAVRTVRSFAQEQYESDRYGKKVDESLKLGLTQAVCPSLTLASFEGL